MPTTGPAYTFGYTNAHQLNSEANTDSTYLWQPSTNVTTGYTVNNLNQYATVTTPGVSNTYGYDGNGNLTGDGTWTYVYDLENRLLTANKTSGGTVAASYVYDPLGRRTNKSGTGVATTYFLSDGTDEIEEFTNASTPTVRYIPGPSIDEPIAMVTVSSGAHEYFHTNKQGSVIAMTGNTGAKVEGPYTYDPYGNCFSGSSPCSSAGEPYRFTGQRFDPETSLYYYRARYYASGDTNGGGRFLQTDPVGYSADLDLYTYVGNDPANKTDPLGRETLSLGFSINGAVIPGVVSGTGSIYLAIDDKGNVGLFVTGGGGGIGGGGITIGESISGGIAGGWSNAEDIHGLQGPFATQSVTVGEGTSVTGEAFEGTYAGKTVVGGTVTVGPGAGVSMTSGLTGTKELTAGKVPQSLHSTHPTPSSDGKPDSNTTSHPGASPISRSKSKSVPTFLAKGNDSHQPHLCTGSHISTTSPCP